MAQAGFNFDRPKRRRLPDARPRALLVAGRGEIARQASADGAALNAPAREDQCARLARYLDDQGPHGATDAEIERDLKWPVNVVTARRNDLVSDGLVIVRWPESRRRSVKTQSKVVIWLATSVVRRQLEATGGGPCAKAATGTTPDTEESDGLPTVVTAGETAAISTNLRGRHDADAAEGTTASAIVPQSNHEHEHGSDLSGRGDLPGDRTGRAGGRSEPARREAHDGGARVETPPSACATRDAESQPEAQSALTRETVRNVAFGTRVLLADGRFAQVRMITRSSEVVVYVFSTREFRTLDPTTLIDRRPADGELVEARSTS